MACHVILYYKYVSLEKVEEEKEAQESICNEHGLKGRILLSEEGVNGTLSGSKDGIAAYIRYMCAHEHFQMEESDFKHSQVSEDENCQPFPVLLIKIVSEIVSTGGKVPKPNAKETKEQRGYLTPAEFHKAIEEKDDKTVILDVRNHNEYAIGHFDDAIDPEARSFSEYFEFMKKKTPEMENKQVLMYCTGGIRCEKASNFLRTQGIENVKHLQGGIHKYLQTFPNGGFFKGKNFVFDKRVAMASLDKTIVGKCIECQCPYDQHLGRNVCTVCRDMVLTCPNCVEKLDGELHCQFHQYLKDCYFTFIDYFTPEELKQQLTALQDILAPVALTPGWKRKRATLRKQIQKLENRLADFNSGKVQMPSKRTGTHCRTCFKLECNGNCWGFWNDQLKRKRPENDV